MGAKVSFKIVSTENGGFSATGEKETWVPEYKDGQLIFVEDLGRIYLDFHDERTCYTPNSLNYVGISTTDPETGKVTIDGKILQPRLNDLVVYGTKEYIWRKNETGVFGWYEMGDEDSPSWN